MSVIETRTRKDEANALSQRIRRQCRTCGERFWFDREVRRGKGTLIASETLRGDYVTMPPAGSEGVTGVSPDQAEFLVWVNHVGKEVRVRVGVPLSEYRKLGIGSITLPPSKRTNSKNLREFILKRYE